MTAELALAVHVLVSFPVTYLHWCIRVFTLISVGGVMYDLQFQLAPMAVLGIFWILEVMLSEKIARNLLGAGRVKLTMANMDTEGDGEIDLEEFMRAGGSQEDFEKIDTDGGGSITLEELEAYEAAGNTLYRCESYDEDNYSASPASTPRPLFPFRNSEDARETTEDAIRNSFRSPYITNPLHEQTRDGDALEKRRRRTSHKELVPC